MSSGIFVLRKVRALFMRTMPMMLTCRELENFVVDYADGTLPQAQRRKFDWHLRLCGDCRRYLEAYGRTIALSQRALCGPDESVPEDVPEELVRAILAARERERR